jgi:hypothetical protein
MLSDMLATGSRKIVVNAEQHDRFWVSPTGNVNAVRSHHDSAAKKRPGVPNPFATLLHEGWAAVRRDVDHKNGQLAIDYSSRRSLTDEHTVAIQPYIDEAREKNHTIAISGKGGEFSMIHPHTPEHEAKRILNGHGFGA